MNITRLNLFQVLLESFSKISWGCKRGCRGGSRKFRKGWLGYLPALQILFIFWEFNKITQNFKEKGVAVVLGQSLNPLGLCEPCATKAGKSSVEEKKNRRSKDLKMTQRRNKPFATPRGKGYKERKISRHEERPAVPRRKQYHETNEGHDDSKTSNLRHEDKRQ